MQAIPHPAVLFRRELSAQNTATFSRRAPCILNKSKYGILARRHAAALLCTACAMPTITFAGLTWADTLTTLFRRDDVGNARLARHNWHCPGCTRTADVDCMLIKLMD